MVGSRPGLRQWITALLLVFALGACGEDTADNTNNRPADRPAATSIATIAPTAPAAPAAESNKVFAGQNNVRLPDGTLLAYQFSLSYPDTWQAVFGSTTQSITSRDPLTPPFQAGDVQISFTFQAFVPPDLITLEQVLAGAPTTPITLAGFDGLRADYTDAAATRSEGSTMLLQLDTQVYLTITVQMAYGERATLEPITQAALATLEIQRP